MRFTVDFQIPPHTQRSNMHWDETLSYAISSHLFTRNEAFYFIFLWASIKPPLPGSLARFATPYIYSENVECMIMVYNNGNHDDEKCSGEGEQQRDGNKTIYGLHTTLVKHENEFYIPLPFFTMRHHAGIEGSLYVMCMAWQISLAFIHHCV